MDVSKERIQQHLRNFSIRQLFVEEFLWDRLKEPPLSIVVDTHVYRLNAVAEKSGVKVYLCDPDAQGKIPADTMLRRIEREVTKSAFEHILIYSDAAHESQVWQWVKRERGKGATPRYSRLYKGQSGELLAQKLMKLAFSFEEEPSAADVADRNKQAFDTERVTKKFYDRFQKELVAFRGFIDGITAQGDREWYASLMLNRLMFIYFIQRQGFLNATSDDELNGERDYLRKRLQRVQTTYGQDEFHSFYRYFLLNLFSDLNTQTGKRTRSSQLDTLLGRIPYLNGGLFDVHQLEQENPNIRIPDTAFERIFDFFDEFDWHLDDRPLHNEKEINPDVLGYIFEKYINQKQMGAYYTKEDITEYISKNTIIPFLFNEAEKHDAIAFRPDGYVWSLLRDDPDLYIYDAVKKGSELPLPDYIHVGIDDISKRTEWNKVADEEYALPTETWREVVARRTRYFEIHKKIVAGQVTSINDLITYNLDIFNFAKDVITYCEGPDLLRAFYDSIEKITVLDPTCGSGAFLFAALNILHPLYEICLIRMQIQVEERDILDAKTSEGRRRHHNNIEHFRNILVRKNAHANRDYFILKSIILNNLYGVDIMEEATEICKLRLFLKLVSQVKRFNDIEPLPDIDFNICAGNTLVGFTNEQEIEQVIKHKMDFDNVLERIEQKAKEVERGFDDFHDLQTKRNLKWDIAESKQQLREKLKILRDELDGYLAQDYGVERLSVVNKGSYEERLSKWRQSHQPFNWFVEFYKIMREGGFNVIIGNPPYVENSTIKGSYQLKGFKTLSCGNLYALVMERCIKLTRPQGMNGMIVQLPIACTDRMIPLQDLLKSNSSTFWLSNYDDRPAKLFDGLEHIRATIVLNGVLKAKPTIWATKYNRWYTQNRDVLFSTISFSDITTWNYSGAFPKVGTRVEENIHRKLQVHKLLGTASTGGNKIYFHNAPQYWIRAMTFKPYFWNAKAGEQLSSHVKSLALFEKTDAEVTVALINSNLFYWWFVLLSNCRDLTMREIERFPLGLTSMNTELKLKLSNISQRLMEDYQKNSVRKEAQYKATGKVVYDEFYPKHSKPIIDEIDRVLAQHYGFTDEELDFIINYDIKYRLGKEKDENDDV